MKKTYAYFIMLLLASTLLGCKKDSETAPSKTDLLTNKNWVISAYTVSPGISVGGVAITDIYAQVPACSRDDISRFETPNVLKDDEGATKCNSTDPQTVTGTWAFASNETMLTIVEQGTTQTFNISSLTDSQMVLTATQASSGVTYTYTITFRKS